jgi:hypothetical protein
VALVVVHVAMWLGSVEERNGWPGESRGQDDEADVEDGLRHEGSSGDGDGADRTGRAAAAGASRLVEATSAVGPRAEAIAELARTVDGAAPLPVTAASSSLVRHDYSWGLG